MARIEELAAKIGEARGLRREAVEEAEALVRVYAQRLLTTHAELTELRSWLDPDRDGIQTGPFGAQLGSHDLKALVFLFSLLVIFSTMDLSLTISNLFQKKRLSNSPDLLLKRVIYFLLAWAQLVDAVWLLVRQKDGYLTIIL